MAKTVESNGKKRAKDYLKLPYMHSVTPQLDGSFHAEILEFPGCIAVGDTMAEAYELLEEIAESWLQANIDAGRSIPEPLEVNNFSGKTVLRMPRSLHARAAVAAQREGVSLNQFIVSAVGVAIGQCDGRMTHVTQNTISVRIFDGPPRGAIDTLSTDHSLAPVFYSPESERQNA